MASTLLARGRSFGGKSGVWFRKKRTQQDNKHGGAKNSKGATLTSSSEGGNTATNIKAKGTQRATTITLIGWDDVRCRPIYSSSIESDNLSSTTVRSDDSSDSENEAVVDSPSTVVDCFPAAKQMKEDFADVSRPKKVRSYGGRKRPISIIDLDDETAYDLMETIQRKPMRKYNDKVEKLTNIVSTAEPEEEKNDNSVNPRRVSTDLQEEKALRQNQNAKLDKDKENNPDSVFNFNETTEEEHNKKETDDCKTPKRRVAAPSSQTSMSAARAFFRHLDNEQLNLTQEPGTSPKRKRTVRTRRKLSLSDKQLSQEYKEYMAACEASKVSPLSRQEYLSNRGAYFRATSMYDGFLDE